ncbi:hypothetical protein [Butyrivibrio sp. NC3005]|uniref:hypothetical protein n=1 Tax=Butyrivibrio sp. NC3005 TaxID=1280685 RepID=UPI00047AD75C|nr:hypothetical protein [Butyrivibrio sp. NC3005]
MNKISSVIFTCLIALLAWLSCGLIFADFKNAGLCYWGGYGFGIFIILSIIVSYLCLKQRNRASTEVKALPVVASFGYLVIGLIVNAVFMVKDFENLFSHDFNSRILACTMPCCSICVDCK